MRIANTAVITAALLAGVAVVAIAKLPPPSDEAKAKAAQTAAKGAWTDKLSAFQLCKAGDRAAEAYRRDVKAAGKEPLPPVTTPPCTDPGPYVATPITPESSKMIDKTICTFNNCI
ncbi:MAG: hypothetical protein ABI667_10165 [Sphingomicrobium sp.]